MSQESKSVLLLVRNIYVNIFSNTVRTGNKETIKKLAILNSLVRFA